MSLSIALACCMQQFQGLPCGGFLEVGLVQVYVRKPFHAVMRAFPGRNKGKNVSRFLMFVPCISLLVSLCFRSVSLLLLQSFLHVLQFQLKSQPKFQHGGVEVVVQESSGLRACPKHKHKRGLGDIRFSLSSSLSSSISSSLSFSSSFSFSSV